MYDIHRLIWLFVLQSGGQFTRNEKTWSSGIMIGAIDLEIMNEPDFFAWLEFSMIKNR